MASFCRPMWWCDLSTFWKRTPSTPCCRMARHQQLPTPFLFISTTQPRHRVDANAKKERFDCFIAHSHLPLTQCIKPPMTAFCEQGTRVFTLGCILRLG